MTQPYAYPPVVPEDPTVLAARLSTLLGTAWDEVLAKYAEVLASANQLRKAEVLATLTELLQSVAGFQTVTQQVAEDYARRLIPAAYAAGAIVALPEFSWTQPHLDAVQSLAADAYTDLLKRSQEAGRTSKAFARAVRAEFRDRAALSVLGKTPTQVGRELTKRLEARGLSAVTYANGAVVPMGTYAEMAVLTKVAVAESTGSLNGYVEAGVRFVEVFDGDCGWTSHDDPDKANGTIRHITDAQSHVLAHPRCRRSFGARPDITTRAQAKDAELSTTAAQRADQAQSEGPTSAENNARAETARTNARNSRRAALHARRQQRLTKPAAPVDPHPGISALPRTERAYPGEDQTERLLNLRHDYRAANPNYYEPGGDINCVHVVSAYELRRRGYDVVATVLPEPLRTGPNPGRGMDDAIQRWGHTWAADAKPVPGPQELTNEVVSWPVGSRGWVHMTWRTGGAHVFNVEHTENGPVFIEAQTGAEADLFRYFRVADSIRVMRTDEWTPADSVLEFVEPRPESQSDAFGAAGRGKVRP